MNSTDLEIKIVTHAHKCTKGSTLRSTMERSVQPRLFISTLHAEVQSLYSATASFSITTFKCAVTSLCNFTDTVNSPKVFSGS